MAESKYMWMIDELHDDRPLESGWFVYLKPGFRVDNAHCFGEDRLADVWKTMDTVEKCDCHSCKEMM